MENERKQSLGQRPTYLGMFRLIVQTSPRYAHESRIFHQPNQSGTRNQWLRSGDDARQAPAPGEMDGLLQTVGAGISGGDMSGFSQEEDGIADLLAREQKADLRAEGGEKDGALAAEAVDLLKDGVGEVVGFHRVCVHLPIVRFKEHWVFWQGKMVMVSLGWVHFAGSADMLTGRRMMGLTDLNVESDGFGEFH